MNDEKAQAAKTPTGAASALSAGLGCELKEPHKLNDVAIFIAGLAEVLQQKLEEAQHCNGIEGAINLSLAFDALGSMASDLAEQISQYAPSTHWRL